MKKQFKIAVIGLGYVGLPLLVELSKYSNVVGYDKNDKRIKELKKGKDKNKEISKKNLIKNNINYTFNEKDLSQCNIYIICVPTPILKSNKPDLKILKNSCNTISKYISNDNSIFESTVFPHNKKICIPILEKSKLKCHTNINNLKKGFYVAYSPERINPGDKKITNITNKLVSSNSSRV